ncbi:MAG: GntR family transcriptional regulator [Opitutaceae bacterium]|jgi:GntR family transcriptional regulator
MLPFSIDLKPGLPVAEQILFAVKRAVATGQLSPGDPFPSVRVLSQELRINPNTAHKVIAALVTQSILITTPAIGSLVADRSPSGSRERAELLGAELERVVVEAKNLGLTIDDVQAGLVTQWKRLTRK